MTTLREWVRDRAAYLVLVVGMTAALGIGFSADQRDIARNCRTGQRSWDALSRVINAAYDPSAGGSVSDIDPKTLPPRTRQLLADLAPLLKPPKPGAKNSGKDHALAALGPRPAC